VLTALTWIKVPALLASLPTDPQQRLVSAVIDFAGAGGPCGLGHGQRD